MHEHVMNNQEHVNNTLEQLRAFKHIQWNLNNYYCKGGGPKFVCIGPWAYESPN